jgi:hypothetical protein
MKTHRSTTSAGASESATEELRAAALAKEADREAAARPHDHMNADAAGRRQQAQAIEQAMARQNVRVSRTTAGAVGPVGRVVLLIALVALVGLIGVWIVLAP